MAPVDDHHDYIYKRLDEQDKEIANLQEDIIVLSKALHDTIKRLKILELNFSVF